MLKQIIPSLANGADVTAQRIPVYLRYVNFGIVGLSPISIWVPSNRPLNEALNNATHWQVVPKIDFVQTFCGDICLDSNFERLDSLLLLAPSASMRSNSMSCYPVSRTFSSSLLLAMRITYMPTSFTRSPPCRPSAVQFHCPFAIYSSRG